MVLEVWKAAYFFLKAVVSYNPVNKLYYHAYKVQQTFFVPAKKKNELSEQHQNDTCLLLKSHYSFWNVFYVVKMCNLSRNNSVRDQLEEASWQNN